MNSELLKQLLKQLKTARDKSGLSLTEMARATGMDRSATPS